jgi:hypothetical protein
MMREQQQRQQRQQHSNNRKMKKKKKKMMRCSFFPSTSQKSSLSDPSRTSADEVTLFGSLSFDPCTGCCLHWICPFVPQKSVSKGEERKSWKTNAKTRIARYFEIQCPVERNRVI